MELAPWRSGVWIIGENLVFVEMGRCELASPARRWPLACWMTESGDELGKLGETGGRRKFDEKVEVDMAGR